jgi:hypothetical protein
MFNNEAENNLYLNQSPQTTPLLTNGVVKLKEQQNLNTSAEMEMDLQPKPGSSYNYLQGCKMPQKMRYFPKIAVQNKRCRNNTMVLN